MGEVVPLPERTQTLAAAVEAFFADKDLATNSRRAYHQTLDTLTAELGGDLPIDKLTTAKIRRTLDKRWGDSAPATWNT